MCLTVKPVGEPDALIGHVRFDERGWETERCQMAQATAPILDSTFCDMPGRMANVRYWGDGLAQARSTEQRRAARLAEDLLSEVFLDVWRPDSWKISQRSECGPMSALRQNAAHSENLASSQAKSL